MPDEHVISIDGACSGKRAACAAVLSVNGKVVAEASRALRDMDGYVLAAEIAGLALASELVSENDASREMTVEVDNPDVPRVIAQGYRPKQFSRIPVALLNAAIAFWKTHNVKFCVLSRKSTPGLRRADLLSSRRLWRRL
jgi:hypothetical protein